MFSEKERVFKAHGTLVAARNTDLPLRMPKLLSIPSRNLSAPLFLSTPEEDQGQSRSPTARPHWSKQFPARASLAWDPPALESEGAGGDRVTPCRHRSGELPRHRSKIRGLKTAQGR